MVDQVPKQLVAGDTWAWTRELADYPAGTWALTYYFENKDETFSAAASASGATHSVSIAAATTAAYKAGRYRWRARAVSGATAITVESGWVDVLLNPSAAGKTDVRSWARRALEAVQATLEGRASDAQSAFTIRDRSVSRYTLKELTDLCEWLKKEVRNEEGGASRARGRYIKVRLTR